MMRFIKRLWKRKKIVEDDWFGNDEALTAAIKKRKFPLERMLEDRQHYSVNDDDADDDENDSDVQLSTELKSVDQLLNLVLLLGWLRCYHMT